MIETIGDDKILGMQLEVVCHDLIEDTLSDWDVWSLELDDHSWLEHPVIKHAVGSQVFGADAKRNFVGEEGSGVAE